MIPGISLAAWTLIHVVISLVALGAGGVVLAAMLRAQPSPAWTAFFLATTILTSVTGFLFPFEKVLPSHVVGVISMVLLSLACYGVYVRRLRGAWRALYVGCAMASFYLNAFVGVAQLFRRVPMLSTIAPTQTEPPFWIAQLALTGLFLVLGVAATRRFRPLELGD